MGNQNSKGVCWELLEQCRLYGSWRTHGGEYSMKRFEASVKLINKDEWWELETGKMAGIGED